jgi:hypothetical protein
MRNDRQADLDDLIGTPRGPGRPRKPAPLPDSVESRLAVAQLAVKTNHARKLEIENAKKMRELVPLDDVRAEWGQMVIDLRQAILAVPSRITGLSRAQMVQLDAELREALQEIARDGSV